MDKRDVFGGPDFGEQRRKNLLSLIVGAIVPRRRLDRGARTFLDFRKRYVPVTGNVFDDGRVELTQELPRTNGGTAENSMRRFCDVFPYTGPEVNVVVRRMRRRRR